MMLLIVHSFSQILALPTEFLCLFDKTMLLCVFLTPFFFVNVLLKGKLAAYSKRKPFCSYKFKDGLTFRSKCNLRSLI